MFWSLSSIRGSPKKERINRARTILLNTEQSVTQIAENTGYVDTGFLFLRSSPSFTTKIPTTPKSLDDFNLGSYMELILNYA